MKLSIIIPVYNTGGYLSRCLDSCLNQDIPSNEYEIIAVDDGSTDNSLDLLKKYAGAYSNIKVLHQSNKRQGAARNKGLSVAQGEYIWFVDSDDWIVENCLAKVCEICQGVDILETDRSYVYYDNSDPYLNIGKWTGVQGYIFNRNFLCTNNLIFKEKIFFEYFI